MFQDFVVPLSPILSAQLQFSVFIGNRANAFFVPSPASLDFSTPTLNQQARVDILNSGTDPFSVSAIDVLATAYQTTTADPLVSGYNTVTVDLTSLFAANAGHMLRLRFAEADNVFTFQMGVDNVNLTVTPVPEPSALILSASGGAILWRHSVATNRRRSALRISQKRVAPFLLADRRSRAVTRVDDRVVRQRPQLRPNSAQQQLKIAIREIRAANRAGKQNVAAEDDGRLAPQNKNDVTGRMAGDLKHLERQFGGFIGLAVAHSAICGRARDRHAECCTHVQPRISQHRGIARADQKRHVRETLLQSGIAGNVIDMPVRIQNRGYG